MHPSPTSTDPFATILRGIADARVDAAAGARARQQWMLRCAQDAGTMRDLLADLADAQTSAIITPRGSAAVRGVVAGLGADVVLLRHGSSATFMRIDRIAVVQPLERRDAVPTARPTSRFSSDRTLVDILRDEAHERAEIELFTDNGIHLSGALRSAGVDTLSLIVGAAPGRPLIVAIDAIALVRVASN